MSKSLIFVAVVLGVTLPLVAQAPVRNLHGALAMPCQNCHTTTSWSPLRVTPEFNHNTNTSYPLRGMHTSVPCNSCHVSKVFTEAGKRCADCHADFHRRQFGAQCESCHTVQGWRANTRATQDHWNRFPLLGAHASVDCDSCHKSAAAGVYVGLSTQCITCHRKDYTSTTSSVNHIAAGFSTVCETCHSVDSWHVANFNHSQFTRFALTGVHQSLACSQCHIGNKFSGTPTDCFSCHSREFSSTTNPNHVAAAFPRDCATCHTTSSWQGARFDHTAMTKFALTGAHTTASCSMCHVGGHFADTPTACSGCHMPDFERTANPDHRKSNFSTQCESCHTTTSWAGARFDHSLSRFPLTGAHTSVSCAQCHTNGRYSGISTDCVSCHLRDYQGTSNPNHVAASFPQSCTLCHTTTQWKGASFDHSTTHFPLTGRHTSATCAQCHTNGVYAGLNTACSSCHLREYQATTNPNHATSGFPQDCQACHTTTQWTGARFDHNATRFPLTGRHTTATCTQCHSSGVYAGLNTACSSCHLREYQATTNPNHVNAGFSQNCQNCHTTTQWAGAQFDHSLTRFPLTGRHASTSCAQCHTNGQYSGLSTACSSCHLNDYQRTTNPNHVAAGFPRDCSMCHTTVQWQGAKFDHNTQTRFALTGRHTTATCSQCHVNNVFAGLGTACVNCHLNDYQKTSNPNHSAAGFSQNCQTCHTTTQWAGATFDHSTTRFPLTGRHTTATCAQCHVNNQYATLSTACSSCHLADYQRSTNPNHTAAGFSQNCQTCHSTAAWSPATFDHNTSTRFPLTGRHTAVACASCHVNNQYSTLSTTCESCHLKNYQATTNPNHTAAGFPQNCVLCHTTSGWTPASFNHTTQTSFPLTGRHTTTTCAQCHSSGVYAGLSTRCDSCHLPEYQRTTNPNHTAAGFPRDCSLCHTTTDWTGAVFNHSTTKFPLTGRHTTVACSTCHVNNQYAGLSTACASCHLQTFNQTTNPNHVTAGFPTDCSLCHTTTDWTGATFNHSTTGFTLTGKHTTTSCALCHVNGRFAGTPTDCYSCHTTEYNSTTNPNHIAAGFPRTCATCHTTTSWMGATFNHTWFPTNHGNANGICSNCHTNSSDYRVFTCTSCHLQTQTNQKHQGVQNYVYASANCYSCHPRGTH